MALYRAFINYSAVLVVYALFYYILIYTLVYIFYINIFIFLHKIEYLSYTY